MSRQLPYYNQFAERNRDRILICPEPHFWTTDYDEKGSIYREMKTRVEQQWEIVQAHFQKDSQVLDIGCGFGRQSIWLAEQGYSVWGIDPSHAFIQVAKALAEKRSLDAKFTASGLFEFEPGLTFSQVLLLDVIEHLAPGLRRKAFDRIHSLMSPGGLLVVSFPFVRRRFRSRVNNRIFRRIKGSIPFFVRREEHPYMIPAGKDMQMLAGSRFERVEELEKSGTVFIVFRKRS